MNSSVEDGSKQPERIRPASEIAARALALFGIVGIGLHAPRNDVAAWLKETGVWYDLSPKELALFEASLPTAQMMIDASWRSEALIVLLWSLLKVDALPPADVQCDTSIFQNILPPYAETSVEQFVRTAARRPDEDLLHLANTYMNLHAEYHFAKRQGRPPRQPVAGEVIQERHHAINWVVGCEGLAWDLITTDS